MVKEVSTASPQDDLPKARFDSSKTIDLIIICTLFIYLFAVLVGSCSLKLDQDGTGLTQYCIGQILLETGRAKEAEEKFAKILSGCHDSCEHQTSDILLGNMPKKGCKQQLFASIIDIAAFYAKKSLKSLKQNAIVLSIF